MSHLLVQLYPEARSFGNLYEAVLYDRAVEAGDHLIPERDANAVPFEGEEVGDRGGDVGGGDGPTGLAMQWGATAT